MLLPAYMSWSYATSFAVLMGVCGAGCIAAAASALRAVGAGPQRTWAALLAIGVSPLVLGSLFDTRFDLWPTLLAVGALWHRPGAARPERRATRARLRREALAGRALPIAVIYLWRRRGGRRRDRGRGLRRRRRGVLPALRGAGADGLRAMFADQLDRPLQVESLGAAVLMAAQHLGMRPLATINVARRPGAERARSRARGRSLDGVRGRGRRPRSGSSSPAAARRTARRCCSRPRRRVAALVAFDRVLSPQYLIWLVPFVLLVRGGRGLIAGGLLFLALGLTQTWFPSALLVAGGRPRRAVVVVPARARPHARRARGRAGPGAQPRRDSEAETEGWPAARQAGA